MFVLEEKFFIPFQGEEKEIDAKPDLEETEGDGGEGRAALLDSILPQNGREGHFLPRAVEGERIMFFLRAE